jgi:tripartite-type tricarboxylate transporter receptor subunit TctC
VGASGNIGTEAVVRAAPDGQTLLVSVNTLVMNKSLYTGLSFDPVKDLAPVILTSWGQLLLVTHPKTNFKTPLDLVAAAKASPGRINYASPGVGTPHHLAMELFKNTSKVFLTHIPYRGTAPAVTDLLGGQVDAMFLPIHVALPQIRAGKLIALGLGSEQRHPLLPNVPTIAESKAGQVNVDMWFGIFAPKNTPNDIIQAYNKEIKLILASEDIQKAFQPQGMDPANSTPEEFGRLVEKDAIRWAELIKSQNIKAE